MRLIAAVLLLVFATPALAQGSGTRGGYAVSPPSPEQRITRAQQIAYFLDMSEEDRSGPERDRAMKRLYFLYREAGDATRSDEWRERRRRFILEQEAFITAGPPLPPPQALCDPTAVESTCVHGAIPRDEDTYWRYSVLAEAAEWRGDYPRTLAMREAAIPFMHGTAPLVSHWVGLANEARAFWQYEASLRLCGIAQTAPLYQHARAEGDRCAAETLYAMEDWAGWLNLRQTTFTGANPDDPAALVRFCIAATRANRRDVAARACDWAAESVATRSAREEERVATRATGASDEAGRLRIVDGPHIRGWREDKARFDAAIGACREALGSPDASAESACGGAIDGTRWARRDFDLQDISNLLRDSGSVRRDR